MSGLSGCPFTGSAQQLWRNLLLAEQVAQHRRLDHFAFWVASPRGNDTLWRAQSSDVFEDFAQLLRPSERGRFRRLETESVLATIESKLEPSDDRRRWWTDGFRDRYLPRQAAQGAVGTLW